LPFRSKLAEAQVGELDVPAHAEICTIDLQYDAGVGECFALVAHRLGDRSEISFLAAVMFVTKEQRHDAGRSRREKRLPRNHLCKRRLEIRGIGFGSAGIANTDCRIARWRFSARTSGIAEHAFGEIRKIDEILVDERVARAAET